MAQVSIFIGGIRPLPQSGRPTGMYKQAACGPLQVGPEGFIDDRQADRRVHGGPEKAIHLYPARHYATLAKAFPDIAKALVAGSIGENLSTPDIDESDVRIGDIWRLGQARLQVCQPRNPCWKIDERYGEDGMAAYIAKHRLTGWYFSIARPGLVLPGDHLELDAATDAPSLSEAMRCCQMHRPPLADLRRIAASPGIASQWKAKIDARIDWLSKQPDAPRST